jgi:hypothetical protein
MIAFKLELTRMLPTQSVIKLIPQSNGKMHRSIKLCDNLSPDHFLAHESSQLREYFNAKCDFKLWVVCWL